MSHEEDCEPTPSLAAIVTSLPTTHYKEVIEVRVPIRFYFYEKDGEEEFDGVEFGPYSRELFPWETVLLDKCMDAIAMGMPETSEESSNEDFPEGESG